MTELEREIASNPLWYHTLELAPGVTTPGWMDLRPIADRLPWPDVRGKRCLDVGTYDGFFAFELERRGASEVVATDIADHTQWDWPLAMRALGPEYLEKVAGPAKGLGFEIAKRALSSGVVKQEISVYDLSPESVGEFDVVVCGSLLLHLKSPVPALEAIRSVCTGAFLSAEQVDPVLSVLLRGRSATWFRGGNEAQWHVPNVAGLKLLVGSAGFDVNEATRPYAVPFGRGYTGVARGPAMRAFVRLATRGSGVPHAAVLAVPVS